MYFIRKLNDNQRHIKWKVLQKYLALSRLLRIRWEVILDQRWSCVLTFRNWESDFICWSAQQFWWSRTWIWRNRGLSKVRWTCWFRYAWIVQVSFSIWIVNMRIFRESLCWYAAFLQWSTIKRAFCQENWESFWVKHFSKFQLSKIQWAAWWR